MGLVGTKAIMAASYDVPATCRRELAAHSASLPVSAVKAGSIGRPDRGGGLANKAYLMSAAFSLALLSLWPVTAIVVKVQVSGL